MSALDQLGHRGCDRTDGAVDLGVPGIGTQGDSHAGSFVGAGRVETAGERFAARSECAARCSASQSTMVIVPSAASTRAVQLSTLV